jgi:hypothetical protein
MSFYRKARLDRLDRGIRQDFGRIYVQFFAPDQPGLLALLDNDLERSGGRSPSRIGCECG